MVRRRAAPASDEAAGDNAVRGPTSALTSFLAAQGIVSRPRQLAEQRELQAAAAEAAGALEAQTAAPAASTSAAPAPAPVEASTSAAKKRKKAKKGDDAGDDFALDFSAERKGRYDNRSPGAITLCAECGKKFTVTKYTYALPDGAGLLCMPCERELGVDGAPAKPAAKKRKTAKPKAAPLEKVKVEVPSLQEACIKIIGRCVDELDEDALGEVGTGNMEKICKIVCKNRSLTPQTLKLFLDISQQELRLFDCSRLDERAYLTLCNLAPRLRSLALRYCGTIDDDILELFRTKLTSLTRLELYGPFLVRAAKWTEYFDSLVGRDFEAFKLQQCPRFEMACLERLVENVPTLVDVQLADLVKLTDDGLAHLHALMGLRHLDVSRAGKDGTNLSDGAVINLLNAVGRGLETLVLDLNESLTDRTLIEGIMPHCRALSRLSLRGLPAVLSTGVQTLFEGFGDAPPLRELNLNRLTDVDDDALAAVVAHSGATLRHLDLNSCDNITDVGLNGLAAGAPALERLDVSFVRAADDFIVKALLDGMPALRVLNVFGNNRVTDTCPRKAGVSIRGQEGQFEIVNWT